MMYCLSSLGKKTKSQSSSLSRSLESLGKESDDSKVGATALIMINYY